MRTSAARTLHLALFGLGTLLFVVFVLPRWWVLTGDIPRTLATAGRIAAGVPIALAAWPVMQLLQGGLRTTPRPPELALRLRAWSGVLHVVAGVLILLAAIAEIWLRLQGAAPWLFGVYGAAAALAILGLLALYLSFVAEQPPAEPKPVNEKKALKDKQATKDSGRAKKPITKRGRKKAAPSREAEAVVTEAAPEITAEETVVVSETETAGDATDVVTIVASDDVVADETATVMAEADGIIIEQQVVEQPAVLRNKRPAGKIRRR